MKKLDARVKIHQVARQAKLKIEAANQHPEPDCWDDRGGQISSAQDLLLEPKTV